MYRKGTGNDKQRIDSRNRTLFLYRNFSQAIKKIIALGFFSTDRIVKQEVRVTTRVGIGLSVLANKQSHIYIEVVFQTAMNKKTFAKQISVVLSFVFVSFVKFWGSFDFAL